MFILLFSYSFYKYLREYQQNLPLNKSFIHNKNQTPFFQKLPQQLKKQQQLSLKKQQQLSLKKQQQLSLKKQQQLSLKRQQLLKKYQAQQMVII